MASEPEQERVRVNQRIKELVLIFCLAALGFVVMGYHPGAEDDGIYLAAVKAQLRPELYPHDAAFVRLQTQATVFVPAMAGLIRATHLPIAWAELLVQFASLFGILWGAYQVARHLFPEPRAHWAGVALLAAMFTLPVSGTAIYIADQYLHPRNIATALILLALARVLMRRAWAAALLLAVGFVVHPIMGAFGISLCVCVWVMCAGCVERTEVRERASAALVAAPLGWMFEAPSPSWRQALATRDYYFLSRWQWYEWLGVVGPLALFLLLWRFAMRREERALSRFALAVFVYGVLQQVVALVMLMPAGLVRLTPLQPMRYLQLVYVLMVLVSGCLLGRHVLKASVWRWSAFLLVVSAGMMIPQRVLFADTAHIEWPGRADRNEWLQAFEWIRDNTPADAYFAVDPRYFAAVGNDAHSFRALAERSVLADAIKDAAVVTQVPELGPEWMREQNALAGWDRFGVADFERLRAQFGVQWMLVRYPAAPGLDCRRHSVTLAVCRIPGLGVQ